MSDMPTHYGFNKQPNFIEIPENQPLVVDLFSGLRGFGRGFVDEGCRVVGVELNGSVDEIAAVEYIESHVMSVFDIDEEWCMKLVARLGPVKFLVASPPCTSFSIASCGHHWHKPDPITDSREPKTNQARQALELVKHTLKVIEWLNPEYFWIENPRGLLRKMGLMEHLQMTTITYCRYGEDRMKPTDLWGRWPESWKPRAMCRNGGWGQVEIDGVEWCVDEDGDPCHVVARRGMATGTQGIKGNALRSVVAHELSLEIARACLNPGLEDDWL
jgi:hypothetical protein